MKEFAQVMIVMGVFVGLLVGVLIASQKVEGVETILISMGATVLSIVFTAALVGSVRWLARPNVENPEIEESQDATTQ